MKASFSSYILNFKRPGGTSRGVLHTKETFFLTITQGDQKGIGECSLFRGLSFDDVPNYEEKLQWLCDNINTDISVLRQQLQNYPSIIFGLEQALLNLEHQKHLYFPSDFTEEKASIQINGLIWMGNSDFMKEQIEEKLEQGFSCIKLKIGVDWSSEKDVILGIRKLFSRNQIELRVDANGAFSPQQAQVVLQELAEMDIHSIEQPIKAGQWEEMAQLCRTTPTPIALDEELIGIIPREQKIALLETIRPQYIILKPCLVGGFSGSDEWIELATERQIGWWITSALESNIGLNAIAQYTFTKNNPMPQGLGTGGVFTNNFETPLYLKGQNLWFKKN